VPLSKSRIMAALQCRKRLYFEVHHPELGEISPQTQAAFDTGHQIGEIAHRVYGGGRGTLIEYEPGLSQALRDTERLMAVGSNEAVFEATFSFGGVLVRLDVLIPEGHNRRGPTWKIVEVKAASSVKDEHLADCAIQAWVFQGLGFDLAEIALSHVDTSFEYRGDGNYSGLLLEEDLTAETSELQAAVPGWVELAKQAAAGAMPEIAVGQHCTTPYPCPFFRQCWPTEARYPVHGLGGSKEKLGRLVTAGYRDIREVPAAALRDSVQQSRIHRLTLAQQAELLTGASTFVRRLGHPRYYLDFETIMPAVPIWPGTHPYETLPFQWSCHIEARDGSLQHAEFLDLSGEPPMRPLAASLIEALATDGPILMYTNYEEKVIRGLLERFPDLAPQLTPILHRLIDLHPVVKENYYHPDMLGSWSLKAVIPTVAPDLDYTSLEEIQEGTAASNAYLEAIRPSTTPELRELLRQRLLDYCRLDTLAMVRLAHFLAGA
jgi:hypothetical protein